MQRRGAKRAGKHKLPALVFLLGGEHVLAQAADGADPILGDIFPGGAGGDAAVGVADGGVIDIAAGADVLHDAVSFRDIWGRE